MPSQHAGVGPRSPEDCTPGPSPGLRRRRAEHDSPLAPAAVAPPKNREMVSRARPAAPRAQAQTTVGSPQARVPSILRRCQALSAERARATAASAAAPTAAPAAASPSPSVTV